MLFEKWISCAECSFFFNALREDYKVFKHFPVADSTHPDIVERQIRKLSALIEIA